MGSCARFVVVERAVVYSFFSDVFLHTEESTFHLSRSFLARTANIHSGHLPRTLLSLWSKPSPSGYFLSHEAQSTTDPLYLASYFEEYSPWEDNWVKLLVRPSIANPIAHPKPTIIDYLTTGRLFGNKEMRILMLGLDAAGKTSTQSFYISLCPVGSGHVSDVTY